jgi:hydantoinase/carbamoylase family amidase
MTSSQTLRQDFETLASIGQLPSGGISRPAFSPDDCEAHDWFLDRARSAGLTAGYDPFGNAVVTLAPADPERAKRPAILIGSHLDTVENGGAFDGALGVMAGLDVLRRLSATGGVGRPVQLVAFRDEEGRFGPFTGSRAFSGTLPLGKLDQLRAPDGEALVDAMRRAGFDPAAAGMAARDMREIALYLELHIEQGSILEREGCSLGVVTSIVGQERLAVRFTGQVDHAGTTPMNLRKDAFAASARFADRFRQFILDDASETLRGTIGIVKVTPNQGNVVPGEVRMGLEIRDVEEAALDRSATATTRLAEQAASEFGVECRIRRLLSEPPVPMAERLRQVLVQAAGATGAGWMELASGANHDAGMMARHVPTAMLFVPSTGGRSHCPEEHTEWHHVEQGVNVLEAAVRRIVEVWT